MDTNATLDSGAAVTAARAAPDARQNAALTRQLAKQLEQMAALTELVAHMESADHATAACQTLAEQLQRFLSVDQVLIGLCNDRSIQCRLTAVSGHSFFRPQGELAIGAQAALQECVAREEAIFWPPLDADCSGGMLAHKQFALTADVEAIISAPLRDASGHLRGVWMVAGKAGNVRTKGVASFLKAAETPVASALSVLSRAEKGRLQRGLDEIRRLSGETRGQAIIAGMALLAILFCIPLHYRAKM